MSIYKPPQSNSSHSRKTLSTKIGFIFDVEDYSEGKGFIIEGLYIGKHHHHFLDSNGKYHRFICISVKVDDVTYRNWYTGDGSNNKELAPRLTADKKMNAGYLNSSYNLKRGSRPDALSVSQLKEILNRCRSRLSLGAIVTNDEIDLWADHSFFKDVELKKTDKVRITTKGDSFFIENLVMTSANKNTMSNFCGETTTWTDKILSMEVNANRASPSAGDGDNEDEWSS